MANMEEYIDWRGDISFDIDPFNEIDNIIFAELAYASLKGHVPGPGIDRSKTVGEVCDSFFTEHSEEEILDSMMSIRFAPFLMKRMKESVRFRDVRMTGHVDEYDEETQKQFSATTFILPDGSYYVAFRGTDSTIVGWKEDFNMAFIYGTAGQIAAAKYLSDNFKDKDVKIRVGGHSKGANFAVFGSAFCDPKVRDKIIEVYSNDGPGFKVEITESDEYKAVLPKVRSIVPEQSMIGMILTNTYDHKVVISTNSGAYQHDALSWQVLSNHFVEAPNGLSEISQFLNETLQTWLIDIDDDTRQAFVDILFETILKSQATTLDDINKDKTILLKAMLEGITTVPAEQQKLVRDIIFKLMKSSGDTLKANVKSRISNSIENTREKADAFISEKTDELMTKHN